MKSTHRTAKDENPGAGGRGASRRRATSFMAGRTKEEWVLRALELEDLLRRVPDICAMRVRYARGELSWSSTLNEFNRDLEAAVPDVFKNVLSE